MNECDSRTSCACQPAHAPHPGPGGKAKLGGAGQSGRDDAAVPLAHSEAWRERKVRRNKAGDEGTLMTKARN